MLIVAPLRARAAATLALGGPDTVMHDAGVALCGEIVYTLGQMLDASPSQVYLEMTDERVASLVAACLRSEASLAAEAPPKHVPRHELARTLVYARLEPQIRQRAAARVHGWLREVLPLIKADVVPAHEMRGTTVATDTFSTARIYAQCASKLARVAHTLTQDYCARLLVRICMGLDGEKE